MYLLKGKWYRLSVLDFESEEAFQDFVRSKERFKIVKELLETAVLNKTPKGYHLIFATRYETKSMVIQRGVVEWLGSERLIVAPSKRYPSERKKLSGSWNAVPELSEQGLELLRDALQKIYGDYKICGVDVEPMPYQPKTEKRRVEPVAESINPKAWSEKRTSSKFYWSRFSELFDSRFFFPMFDLIPTRTNPNYLARKGGTGHGAQFNPQTNTVYIYTTKHPVLEPNRAYSPANFVRKLYQTEEIESLGQAVKLFVRPKFLSPYIEDILIHLTHDYQELTILSAITTFQMLGFRTEKNGINERKIRYHIQKLVWKGVLLKKRHGVYTRNPLYDIRKIQLTSKIINPLELIATLTHPTVRKNWHVVLAKRFYDLNGYTNTFKSIHRIYQAYQKSIENGLIQTTKSTNSFSNQTTKTTNSFSTKTTKTSTSNPVPLHTPQDRKLDRSCPADYYDDWDCYEETIIDLCFTPFNNTDDDEDLDDLNNTTILKDLIGGEEDFNSEKLSFLDPSRPEGKSIVSQIGYDYGRDSPDPP